MLKKSKLPVILFIISSLATFIAVGILYIVFNINSNYEVQPTYSISEKDISADKYYLNKDYNEGDPFITKQPSLKEMLAGPIITAIDPNMGDRSAPVTIVEFADFECNFCYQQEQVFKRLMQKYKYKIKLIWKDYPASDEKSISFQTAIAARCAQAQDKFWPYHDFLFDNNKKLGSETYYGIAKLLDLNINAFKECFENPDKASKLINDNIKEANALDIGGVPFIYINDQEVMGEISLEELERIVKIELNKMDN